MITRDDKGVDVEFQALRKLLSRAPHVFSAEFRAELKNLLDLVLEYGISKVPATSIDNGKPRFTDTAHERRFLAAVHDGWKQAQLDILQGIRKRLVELASLAKEWKVFKAQDTKPELALLTHRIALCNAEVMTLRRFLDSVCWILLNGQHHVIRRLHLEGRVPAVTIEQIDYILPVLALVNADPLVIAIACDATTFIGTFDLLVVDRNNGWSTGFVEVKHGEKNLELATKAQFAAEVECAAFEAAATAGMTPTDHKQFERTKRQALRLKSIEQILHHGSGVDHRTGYAVHIPDEYFEPVFFADSVTDLCEKLDDKSSWAIDIVDGCLYLGAYSKPEISFGFILWLKELGVVSPRIISQLQSLEDPICRPLPSSFLPKLQIAKIVNTEITVLMALDVDVWIASANKTFGERFFLETKKKSNKLLSEKQGYTLATHNGQLIAVHTEAGDVNYIGWGALNRLFFDFQTPASVAASLLVPYDMKPLRQED